jgi:hypothetical protein
MNAVITAEQAKKITGGRTPLVPVEYEQAVTALQACITLDEAKYWSEKSEALAAWAKIYRDGATLRKAKCLKLHAYRRMGELAAELRPSAGMVRTSRGATTLLVEHGFSKNQAQVMRTLARMERVKFEQELVADNPRSPSKFAHQTQYLNPVWQEIYHRLQAIRCVVRKHSATEAGASLSGQAVTTARQLAVELLEWLDAFEQALPKEASSK